MSSALSNQSLARTALGFQVSRAAGNLPQTTHSAIFTITGGRIEVVRIVGVVTTVIQSGANNLKLTSYPTTGTSGDLCTTTDIASLEVGGMVTIDGTVGNALVLTNAFGIKQMTTRLWLPIGAIHWDCSASKTGQIAWELFYVPIDSGATVVAA